MQTKRPNIVLILADDMGYSDIGCYGSEIATPNLDGLAANGVRFTQMYNCARCCPSRASLLTGVYPHQAGIGDMVRNLGNRAYQGYLREDCVTIGEVLGKAGYFTGYTGKWHTGGSWPRRLGDPGKWRFDDPTHPTPRTRGFERFYGNLAGGGSYFEPAAIVEQESIVELPDDFYTTDHYTTSAIEMIDRAVAGGRPFFVHVCYNAPHWPLHAWPEDIEKYRAIYDKGWDHFRTARHESMKGLGVIDPRWPISRRDPDAPAWDSVRSRFWESSRMAAYAGMVDRLDRNVGRLVAEVKKLGQLDNTIIIFLSDNGGSHEVLPEGARKNAEIDRTRDGREIQFGNIEGVVPGARDTFMSYDRPWANLSNTPFRLFKHWIHEGGISTPCIVSWPAQIKNSVLIHTPCHIMDITATCMDVAGADYPAEREGMAVVPMEGKSFLPLLHGQAWRRGTPIYWEHEGNRAVRDGTWKLVQTHAGPWELYNMEEDRTELKNRAESEPGRVQRLVGLYGEWADRCGVLPWRNGRPCAGA